MPHSYWHIPERIEEEEAMTTDFNTDVDQALLISYDWDLACQDVGCQVDHPTATHMIIHLQCVCPPKPVCSDCAAVYQEGIDQKYEPSAPWGCYRACRWCEREFTGDVSNQYRVEPLP